MTYSSTGVLAAAVLLIINHDVLFWRKTRHELPAQRDYRKFLLCVLAYYCTDILWGFLDEVHSTLWIYTDTLFYFLAIAMSVLFWTQFVIAYLEEKDAAGRVLLYTGRIMMAFEYLVVVINFYWPILFRFDEAGGYHPGFARYLSLTAQIMMFLLTSLYTLAHARKSADVKKNRYRAIGVFGLVMAVLLTLQILYPLLPLYSVGYMLGSCLLHAFVIEDEKEEYRRKLEEALQREQAQRQELGSTRKLAYTDPLTGVKSKLAYVEKEAQMEQRIAEGSLQEFAVAVFDLNELKKINDTLGHENGDRYIVSACRIICNCFKHSPVFRIGGDEFVAILEGADYQERYALLTSFNRHMDENLRSGQVVVSAGLAEYFPEQDKGFQAVFDRADRLMYSRKEALKAIAV